MCVPEARAISREMVASRLAGARLLAVVQARPELRCDKSPKESIEVKRRRAPAGLRVRRVQLLGGRLCSVRGTSASVRLAPLMHHTVTQESMRAAHLYRPRVAEVARLRVRRADRRDLQALVGVRVHQTCPLSAPDTTSQSP